MTTYFRPKTARRDSPWHVKKEYKWLMLMWSDCGVFPFGFYVHDIEKTTARPDKVCKRCLARAKKEGQG